MAKIKLRDELVEVEDGLGGYYTVDITLTENGNEGYCHIPGRGRVLVYKKLPEYSFQPISFAWYVKEEREP